MDYYNKYLKYKTDNGEKGNHYRLYFSNTGKVKKNIL